MIGRNGRTFLGASGEYMRIPHAPVVLRRFNSCRLVLGAVLLTTITVAALAAALASFAGQVLPQAVSRQLAASRNTTVTITGALNSALARTDTAVIRSAVRAAFGPVPVTLYGATWSDSLGLPASYGKAQIPLMQAASPAAIATHAALVAGAWPGAPTGGQPIPAAIPASVATRLRLSVGEVLSLRDRNTGAHLRISVAGVFAPLDPAAPYWNLDVIGTSGAAAAGGFITYGPLVVDPAAFSSGEITVGGASWVAVPRTALIRNGDLTRLAGQVTQLESFLRQSPSLGGLQVTTNLPGLLTGLASNLLVARSLLVIGALQLLLLAAAALTLATRLLAGQRGIEAALMSARGGSRWQLARLNAAEALPIAGISAIAGALLGSRLAGLMTARGPLRAAGLRVGAISSAAWWAAAAAALFCLVATLGPAMRPATPGAARVRRGRQAAVAGIIRAGGDIAVIALAVLAGWQLRRYSAIGRTISGGIGIDPVLATAPALALAGGTVILMRLLPAGARGADRLASLGRRLLGALAAWEISRRPLRQSGPALLVVLAVATGMLALAQRASWQRSARDQAAFSTGANARVQTHGPVPLGQGAAVARAPGEPGAMPVARITSESTGIVLAVDAREAPATVLLRPDQSPLTASSLWQPLVPAAPEGIAVPGHPARLEIAASLGPAGVRLGQVPVSLSVQDAAGLVYTVPAGTLEADGHTHTLVADVAPARHAAYPLRLLAISLTYAYPPAKTPDAVLTVNGFAASAGQAGVFPVSFAAGRAMRGWSRTASSEALIEAESNSPPVPGSVEPAATAGWLTTASGAQSLTFDPGHGLLPIGFGTPLGPIAGELTLTAGKPGTPTVPPIPGIATQAYLDATRVRVGATTPIVVNGVTIPVRIVASVAAFPTVTGPGGALIVDQATVQDILAAQAADPVQVTEWWMRPHGRPAGLPAGSTVTYRAAVAAALLANPLSSAPQEAMLAVAVAAALLAAVGFAASVAASAAERRSQDALLAALGLARGARARLLCLEELMLSIPSAAAGLLLGAAAARLLIPAITLTPAATAPVPPALAEFPWPLAAALALVVATVPVLAAAATLARSPDPAEQLRAAES